MMYRFILILLVVTSVSCDRKSEVEAKIEKIPVDLKVIRFDEEFAAATPATLPALQNKYPFLFPESYPDSLWTAKLNDTIQQELNLETQKQFGDFSRVEDDLYSLFQHVKFYDPSFKTPTIITITSEVDYKNKVLWADPYLFIALDTYLGDEHPFYVGIQEYLKKNFRPEQIVPDVANEIAKKMVSPPQQKTFLSHMIFYGKLLYLKDLWLPEISENELIGYSTEELDWVKSNEDQVWRYFVENEVLFDSDTELYTRFLYPAPFSKFYLELDSESPDRLGQFIGWKIVRKYMEKSKSSVKELIKADAETIFNTANYKPKQHD